MSDIQCCRDYHGFCTKAPSVGLFLFCIFIESNRLFEDVREWHF